MSDRVPQPEDTFERFILCRGPCRGMMRFKVYSMEAKVPHRCEKCAAALAFSLRGVHGGPARRLALDAALGERSIKTKPTRSVG